MPTISGTTANDNMVGTTGNDIFQGSAGDDTMTGGGGSDAVDFETSPAGVTVNLATGSAQNGFGGTDVLNGIGQIAGSEHNDTLTGDAGANYILGRGGDDLLVGGGGADILDASLGGNDTLVGGSGNVYMIAGEGHDVFQGGAGFNTIDYSKLAEPIAADLYSGTWKDTFENISNLSHQFLGYAERDLPRQHHSRERGRQLHRRPRRL